MICTHCNNALPLGSEFCMHCGRKLKLTQEVPSANLKSKRILVIVIATLSILIAILGSFYLYSTFEKEYIFGQVYWGMSREQLISSEGIWQEDNNGTLKYQVENFWGIDGLTGDLLYSFDENADNITGVVLSADIEVDEELVKDIVDVLFDEYNVSENTRFKEQDYSFTYEAVSGNTKIHLLNVMNKSLVITFTNIKNDKNR